MAQSQMKGILEQKNAVKIIGVQFSILSPEEIRNGSVAEITNRDGYVGNKPVINGIFDPRMGVLEPGLVCPTDGLTYMQTPGYFGHIELARPIFYIQYINTILNVSKCVCLKCSKLLMNKEVNAHVWEMSPADRWHFVQQNTHAHVKIRRCGDKTNDGCGCLQPSHIRKDGLKLIADWNNLVRPTVVQAAESSGSDAAATATAAATAAPTGADTQNQRMVLTPEILLKCFRRISDEDVSFMGLNPTFSRPDWMICQVLAVPPPAVRPSVKQDSQQRSEDDLTHAMINIIKTNRTLQDKMRAEVVNPRSIDDYTDILQYYVATLVDNKLAGTDPIMQRSGRPIKSIKERINGKHGRVRGNLEGKRVDYSARSVITPDPQLSIRDVGVPMKIASNITTKVVVNKRNEKFLTYLVRNGDTYPGAKILERPGRLPLHLRFIADRTQIVLQLGDIVHRHILEGDAVLFNRQPTLHRMSMMCHIARIMPVGDTFRMNVGDTKPYNADFDGDEMNLHMPQDVESTAELLQLAAVPWQIITPAKNEPIIGIFQDSLLGSYQFTRPDLQFTMRQTMNMLVSFNHINLSRLRKAGQNFATNTDILSQILPPMSLYRAGKDKPLIIRNGQMVSGQLNKSALAEGSNGIIHRICNDFGNMAAVSFIDNLQNIITEYMKFSAYSVGVSDLQVDDTTNLKIRQILQDNKLDVQSIIDQTHMGVFENKSGHSNQQEFETQVINTLNKANAETSGKVKDSMKNSGNRFSIMVAAGSKGSDINISQMVACLGQQVIEGKRVAYGFEHRTLPHFTKFDDSPVARGFVANSFIAGLTPEELFFHAMGGRMGIIDTAIKTSQTGYIQRRLIKGLEDLKVEYDMTVRNNKGRVVQFVYGEDGFDAIKVEKQSMPISTMTLEDLYSHFQIPTATAAAADVFEPRLTKQMAKDMPELTIRMKGLLDEMLDLREKLVYNVFNGMNEDTIFQPVAFRHIIQNVQHQQHLHSQSVVDLTPLEAMHMIDQTYASMISLRYTRSDDNENLLYKALYYYNLNLKDILLVKRFNKAALFTLLHTLLLMYKRSIIAPGEMVGIIAAQSIGEPTTQMTLNTFHLAGVASKSTVTRGLGRMEEILELRQEPKDPSCTIYLLPSEEGDQANALRIRPLLEHTRLRTIVESVQICFEPNQISTNITEDNALMQQYRAFEALMEADNSGAVAEPLSGALQPSNWILRLKLKADEMFDRNITMEDVHIALQLGYGAGQTPHIQSIHSDYNSDNLVFRLRVVQNVQKRAGTLDTTDEIYILKNLQESLLDNLVLRGIKNLRKVVPRKQANSLVLTDGCYVKKETWVLDTVGSNLMDLLALDNIDTTRTITNNIKDVRYVLGIEAARQVLYNEIVDVIEETYINHHHLSLLCDRMTCSDSMSAINAHGINTDDIGPLAKASFEETPAMFLKAATYAELDNMRGVSANVMCGQEGYFGTSAFQVLLNLKVVTRQPTPSDGDRNNYFTSTRKQPIYPKTSVKPTNTGCGADKIQLENSAVFVVQETPAVAEVDDDVDMIAL